MALLSCSLLFVLAAVVFAVLAATGYRGRSRGGSADSFSYGIPDRVRDDEALLARAHELIAFWCTGAAVLSLAPLVPLHLAASRDVELGLMPLGVLAFYSLVVTTIGGYPFEKIKQLGTENERKKRA